MLSYINNIGEIKFMNLKEIIGISELNIGHAVMSRALSVGFETAVSELKELID